MKTAKLIIGIVSIVLFIIIMFQSCAVGVVNALEENANDLSGGAGVFVAFGMLIAGIIGIAARSSRGGGITAGIIYLIIALIGFVNLGTFKDLMVWSILALAFAIVFLIGSFTMPKKSKGK